MSRLKFDIPIKTKLSTALSIKTSNVQGGGGGVKWTPLPIGFSDLKFEADYAD